MSDDSRMPGLDELRGLAISLVVLSHAGPVIRANGGGELLVLAPAWGVGVDLFFVISGLVVYRSLRALRRQFGPLQAARVFYIRRGMRIVPLAWCIAAILAIWPDIAGPVVTPADVRAAFTFTSNLHWAPCFGGAPGCGTAFAFAPYWSVATEMQFYLVAPFLVLHLPRNGVFVLAVVALFIGVLIDRPWGGELWAFRSEAIAVGLSIGATIETRACPRFFTGVAPIAPGEAALWMALAATFLAVLPAAAQGRATAGLALLCGVIVLRAAGNPASASMLGRFLGWLGGISYAAYLIHLPVLAIGTRALTPFTGVYLAAGACVLVAAAAAWVMTAALGDRLRDLGREWTSSRPGRGASS